MTCFLCVNDTLNGAAPDDLLKEISSGSCDRWTTRPRPQCQGQVGPAQLQFELQFTSVQHRPPRSTQARDLRQ
jgi:hypothetical protein